MVDHYYQAKKSPLSCPYMLFEVNKSIITYSDFVQSDIAAQKTYAKILKKISKVFVCSMKNNGTAIAKCKSTEILSRIAVYKN